MTTSPSNRRSSSADDGIGGLFGRRLKAQTIDATLAHVEPVPTPPTDPDDRKRCCGDIPPVVGHANQEARFLAIEEPLVRQSLRCYGRALPLIANRPKARKATIPTGSFREKPANHRKHKQYTEWSRFV